MNTAQDARKARDARLAAHCREGYHLAQRDPPYRATVLSRLQSELGAPPDDLWAAIPWIWTAALSGALPQAGARAGAVSDAASILSEWLAGDAPMETLKRCWSEGVGTQLDLGSTLRSHPFADLRSWPLRPPITP